jgi:hypothetical protein
MVTLWFEQFLFFDSFQWANGRADLQAVALVGSWREGQLTASPTWIRTA